MSAFADLAGQKHHELLAALAAARRVSRVIHMESVALALPARTGGPVWTQARKAYLKRVEEAATKAELPWPEWRPLVVGFVEEQRAEWAQLLREALPPRRKGEAGATASVKDRVPRGDELRAALRRLFDSRQAALKRIPSSLGKARTAMAYLLESSLEEETYFPDLLASIDTESLPASKDYAARLREQVLAGELPSGPDYWEDEWAISWIRYAERHVLHHSHDLIQDTSEELAQSLQESLQRIWPDNPFHAPCPNLLGLLQRCWAFSSSLRVRVRVTPIVRDALRIALTWQQADGGWKNASNSEQSTDHCADTTATAVCCLLRYQDHHEWDSAITRGITWLLKNENPTGGWGRTHFRGGTHNLNILTTVAALDSMRLFGSPSDHAAVMRAEAALMAEQAATGTWVDYRGHGELYLSSLVIGYFQRRRQRPSNMQEAIVVGRGLMLKAHALCWGETPTDNVLALVSLFHGLEYVLYGLLLEDGTTAVRKNNGETIGFRNALHELENTAKRRGLIGEEGNLPHKTQLLELAAKRDEVIHRMGMVQSVRVKQFVESAFAFVSRLDVNVLGYSLLE